MVSILSDRLALVLKRAPHVLPVAITLALMVLLLAALASTYFGHSRSPYDICYGPNGRSVSCTVLEAVR
jgi:hypothetical protein